MPASAASTLQPLIAQARKEGKWLHSRYQDIWFSPDELEALNREGRFLWGAVNWTLRDPNEMVQEKAKVLKKAEQDYLNAQKRLSNWIIQTRSEG
jgi:hypothetical protein